MTDRGKTTHMWRSWGHTSEFPFGIYWWTLRNPKNQNFEKMKKNCWKNWRKKKNNCSFYTCVPKTTTIWGTIPEIQSETTFLSFWAIFCPLTPPFTSPPPNNPENQNCEKWKSIWRCHHVKLVQQKTWSNDVSFLRYGVQQT